MLFTNRRLPTLIAGALTLAVPMGQSAMAQSAGDVAKRPLDDVNMDRKKVPPVLAAIDNPYSLANTGSCRAMAGQIAGISGAIGPDFDTGAKAKRNAAGEIGVAAVDTVIPFSGLVRAVSGADAAQKHRAAAVALGIARRGFLRGLEQGRHCR